jgi:stage V sporulation protein G
MEITEVKVVLRNDDRLKGFVTITFDNCFVVRGVKIIHSARGLFVAMPARRKPDGTFQDVAHPIHSEMRARLEERVIAEFLRQQQAPPEERPGSGDDGDEPDGF